MTARQKVWLTGPLVALALAGAGCGGETRNPVVAVEGKAVFADGSPLPAGTRILLNPTEGNVGTASAVTTTDGTFALTHVTGRTGAEVGSYTVVLQPPEGGDGAAFSKLVPRDYADGSKLSAEVRPDMPPLELKVPKLGKKR